MNFKPYLCPFELILKTVARGSINPLFSVLVANYNRGEYIREMIESVLNQTYKNLELIIVDDGSTDDSVRIIESFLTASDRIRLYRSPSNAGCGNAMSLCVSYAKGEFMGYCGSDDTLVPDAVEVMVNAHVTNPNCSLIHSTHYVCDENLIVQRLAYGASAIPPDTNYLIHGTGVTGFATFTRYHYDKTEGVNATFKRAVDQDFYYKLEEVGNLLFVDKPLCYYRVNQSGISTKKNISKARYWFARAKEDAYKRRLNDPLIKNISRKDLDAWWSVMYVTKSSSAFQKGNICKGFYWMVLSLKKSTFDKYTLTKIKSFFLNTWFHGVYNQSIAKWKIRS